MYSSRINRTNDRANAHKIAPELQNLSLLLRIMCFLNGTGEKEFSNKKSVSFLLLL